MRVSVTYSRIITHDSPTASTLRSALANSFTRLASILLLSNRYKRRLDQSRLHSLWVDELNVCLVFQTKNKKYMHISLLNQAYFKTSQRVNVNSARVQHTSSSPSTLPIGNAQQLESDIGRNARNNTYMYVCYNTYIIHLFNSILLLFVSYLGLMATQLNKAIWRPILFFNNN